MAATLYSDNNGARVIVRHKGPAGRGIAAGGTTGQVLQKKSADPFDTEWVTVAGVTNAVIGPASVTNERIAVFDGTTGKLVKDGGKLISDLATTAALEGKVDKVTGFGLSANDFTSLLKTKLQNLSERGFRGVVDVVGSLPPLAEPGDYAVVTDDAQFAYCVTANTWTLLAMTMTASDIAELIFNATDFAANNPSSVWGVDNCRVFTTGDKTTLDTHAQLLLGISGGAGIAVAPYRYIDNGNYILQNSDRTVDFSGTYTATLPTALTNVGTVFCIKNSGAGTITVTCAVASEKIDGLSSVTLDPLESVTVQSTGLGRGYIII